MKLMLLSRIGKRVLFELLMLMCIIFIIILLLNIPQFLNFHYENGAVLSKISFGKIYTSSIKLAKIVFNKETFSIVIEGYNRNITIGQLLVESIKKSSIIFFSTLFFSIIIGIGKGVFDSRKKKGSTLSLLSTLIPISMPDVLLIALVQTLALFFWIKKIKFFGIGPIMIYGSDTWVNAIYPTLAVTIIAGAYIARITAIAIEEVYDEDYIITARGKGCSEIRIVFVHTIKDVIIKIIAAFPNIISIIFSSTIIAERMFEYKGIGFQVFDLCFATKSVTDKTKIAFVVFMMCLAMIYYVLLLISRSIKKMIWTE